MSEDDFERFMSKVAPPDTEGGCHEWLAAKDKGGYGQFLVAGKTKKAHRLAYEHFVGEIPPGFCVLHRCDNRACCLPDHLSVGTHQQNSDDMKAKGRAARGCDHGMAKLTEADVRTIKARYLDGRSQRAIAAQFGVAHSQIGCVLRGITWKHVI